MGRIQDFKLGGAQLLKLRRAEGGAKIFGVFRVKNHDFTPKNHIFSNCGGRREIFGVFRVKNHHFTPDFTPDAPPLDPPLLILVVLDIKLKYQLKRTCTVQKHIRV
jgi:hypothetical protein